VGKGSVILQCLLATSCLLCATPAPSLTPWPLSAALNTTPRKSRPRFLNVMYNGHDIISVYFSVLNSYFSLVIIVNAQLLSH
jgi:hypothetical protein